MEEQKRYYWMRLKENFFDEDAVDYLLDQDNGCEYVILYLRLCLKSLKAEGALSRNVGDKIIPYTNTKISEMSGFSIALVSEAMKLFREIGLVVESEDGVLFFPYVRETTGSKAASDHAERQRRYRERVKLRKQLEECTKDDDNFIFGKPKKSLPFIDKYLDKARYGGNHNIVLIRDECSCRICGSQDDLDVHHIDGFVDGVEENNKANKLITLCHLCHMGVHAKKIEIPQNILFEIGYNDTIVTGDVTDDVTSDTTERHKSVTRDRDKRKSIEIEIDKGVRHAYGEYSNVFLSDDGLAKFKDEYPELWSTYIDEMSGYLAASGKKYKNYLAALRNWAKRDLNKHNRSNQAPEHTLDNLII